jgi:hypothetical protein
VLPLLPSNPSVGGPVLTQNTTRSRDIPPASRVSEQYPSKRARAFGRSLSSECSNQAVSV